MHVKRSTRLSSCSVHILMPSHASSCVSAPLAQVMALIAYLMEHKNNFGPHLIIVPNAVIVNWKSELQQWLPTVK